MQEQELTAEQIAQSYHCRYCDRTYKCPEDKEALVEEIKELVAQATEQERIKNKIAALGVITGLGYEGILNTDQIIELNQRLDVALQENTNEK